MRVIFISLVALILFACSTAPTHINYYLLDNAVGDFQSNAGRNIGKQITLQKLQLATYLQSASLPLLQHDHGVVYASQHVWAEPIQLSINRVLTNDFNHYSTHQLVPVNTPNSKNSEYQLQINIDHFSATDNAEVILVGHYWLSQNKSLLTEHSFHLRLPLNSDGFKHSVSQQRQLINELAKMLADEIKL